MKKNPRFIKILASAMALSVLNISTAWSGFSAPGSLAVLEPAVPSTGMRAAWDGIRNAIYLDPLLLTRGREDVLRVLDEWHEAADSVRSARKTADRITLERTQSLIDQAWSFYYDFQYKRADEGLSEAQRMILTPGDSAFRTRLMFEIMLLRGIVARSAGDKSYRKWLRAAAAVDPGRELSQEKYSPETITIFQNLRDELLEGDKVQLLIQGTPKDAAVVLGGVEISDISQGTRHAVIPGTHFLEVSAPGYETWGMVLEANRFEPLTIRFELVPGGPEAGPEEFFLERLKEGDRSYMALLAEKLDVDYLFLTDPHPGSLRAWLVGRDGRTVDSAVLWEPGEDKFAGAARAADLLKPLRQDFNLTRTTSRAPLSLPAVTQEPSANLNDDEEPNIWTRYVVPVGLLLLVGAAASADRGSGTTIEAQW